MSQNVAAKLRSAKEKHLAGKIAEAEKSYRELLQAHPGLNEVLHPLGIALQQQGRHAEALDYIARWLKIAPKDYEGLVNQGSSLLNLGRAEEAAASYRQALALRPSAPETHLLKAMAEQQIGDLVAAEKSVRSTLSLLPNSPESLFMLGNILCAAGRRDAGMQAYRDALRHRPTMVEPMINLASQLQGLNQREEAAALYREALRLRPGAPEALLNLSTMEYEDGADPEQTIQKFQQVLSQLPDHPDTLNNIANLLMNMNRLEEAQTYMRRRLAVPPDASSSHGTAAALFMLMGQWEEGWQHFEWRWLRDNLPVPLRDFGKPEWQGEDISDKTLLIHHEQGLGDSIQFVRFALEMVKRAAHVILEVPRNLIPLYGCIPGVTLAVYDEPLPSFDVHIAIMSLPYVLGVTVDSVPAPIPYLHADPARVEAWRDRVPQQGFRIGIVWQGKPGTGVDKGRSYTLDQLAPIARVPGVTLVSLQKGYGLDQLERLPEGMKVETLGPDFDEGPGAFLDTAAVMQHMDLIISSDTSVAHLAGALGRPVWVPLKFSPDWRWMVDRGDSPWYPGTMRLFRQTEPGDWAGVFQRLAADVAALKGGDRSKLVAPPPPPRGPAAPFPLVPRPPLPVPMPPVKLVDMGLPAAVQATPAAPAQATAVGECLDHYMALCTGLLLEGDTVIEAGASVGAFTLALARAVGPSGNVHCFEPQHAAYGLLSRNVRENSLEQVHAHQVALGASKGHVFVQPANSGGIAMSVAAGDPMPIVTVDSLELPALRLLKADVEGTGMDVVLGAEKTIIRCRPALYLTANVPEQASILIDRLTELGYRLWWHPSGPNQKNPVLAMRGMESGNSM
ncbi:MAG: FkbM family methyltransferase, partial [Niveispirillum sp.]|nr:FkbM family methyltransferase [Niveispirillum sp.]